MRKPSRTFPQLITSALAAIGLAACGASSSDLHAASVPTRPAATYVPPVSAPSGQPPGAPPDTRQAIVVQRPAAGSTVTVDVHEFEQVDAGRVRATWRLSAGCLEPQFATRVDDSTIRITFLSVAPETPDTRMAVGCAVEPPSFTEVLELRS